MWGNVGPSIPGSIEELVWLILASDNEDLWILGSSWERQWSLVLELLGILDQRNLGNILELVSLWAQAAV